MQKKDIGTILKDTLLAAKDAMLVPLLAVFTAIIVGGIVIAAVGGNPFAAYLGLFEGCIWLCQGTQRNGCLGNAIYFCRSGCGAGLQRWLVQYRR